MELHFVSKSRETQIIIPSFVLTLGVIALGVTFALGIYWQLIPSMTYTESVMIGWVLFVSIILVAAVTCILLFAIVLATFNLWPTHKNIGT